LYLPSSLRIRNCLFRDVTKDTSPILLSRQGDVQWPPCEHKRAHRSHSDCFPASFSSDSVCKRRRLLATQHEAEAEISPWTCCDRATDGDLLRRTKNSIAAARHVAPPTPAATPIQTADPDDSGSLGRRWPLLSKSSGRGSALPLLSNRRPVASTVTRRPKSCPRLSTMWPSWSDCVITSFSEGALRVAHGTMARQLNLQVRRTNCTAAVPELHSPSLAHVGQRGSWSMQGEAVLTP